MKITRAELERIIQPGDFIVVSYLRPDIIQAEIARLSASPWMHALRCLGGPQLVEADVVGVVRSNLKNYMRGNCRLLVRRAKPALTAPECAKITKAAKKLVGEGYDFGMILGMAGLFTALRVLRPLSPRLGNWCLKHLDNLFAVPGRTTCAELVVITERPARADFMRGWPAPNVAPAELARAQDCTTVADWHAPVLVRG